ncbi:MAG: hypothetical protein CVV20_05335, partial [Gemmatimonadetes bacterium HGW-Gemmatimonadetes-1]
LLIVLDEFCDGRGITPRIRKLELSFDFISQDPGLMKEFIVAHLYLRHQRSKSKVFKGTFYTNDLRGSANGLRCYLKARKSEKAFTRFELHLAKGPVRQLGIKWLLNDLERFDLRKHFAFMEMDGARAVRTLVGRSAPTNPTDTLREKLLEESLIVALVTVLFLLHVRSALVAIIVLPMGILLAFLAMRALGVSANIMSLGGIAIAIGAMVDGAIVMIENMHKHLERSGPDRPVWETVRESAIEVGPSLFYALLIITFSFLPVFALEAQEGRLFKPLAFTKTFAMAGAALLSITLVPVLMGYLIRGKIRPEHDNPVNRWLTRAYQPVIAFTLRRPWTIIGTTVLVLLVTILPWRRLGSEFMPTLHEGSVLFMPTTVPGVSIAQSVAIMRHQDSILASFPEVATVLGKAGRANTATDPAPLDMFETTVILK